MAPSPTKNKRKHASVSGDRKPAYKSGVAKAMASKKMYTASGESIYNLEAFLTAGGKAFNGAGERIDNPRAYCNSIEASMRQNTTEPKYLYHYTTPEAAASISASGILQASSDGLAGPGTYWTAKPPRSSTTNLLTNNYASASARDPSHVHSYVRMENDNGQDLAAMHVGGQRDVWKINGSVDLEQQHGSFVAKRNKQSKKKKSSSTLLEEYNPPAVAFDSFSGGGTNRNDSQESMYYNGFGSDEEDYYYRGDSQHDVGDPYNSIYDQYNACDY